jgi:hypothetical protein
VAAIGLALATAVASALTDGHVNASEGIQIATAGATAVGVFLVPAIPQFPQVKTWVAVLLAVLGAAAGLIADGWSLQDTVNLLVAALGVVAVRAAPAQVHEAIPGPTIRRAPGSPLDI